MVLEVPLIVSRSALQHTKIRSDITYKILIQLLLISDRLVMDIIWGLYTLCSKKTCYHLFDDKLNLNCPFKKIFATLITKTIGRRQVFLFSHLTYFVPLLYLGNLSRPDISQN